MVLPVAIETFGAWGTEAKKFISELGTRITSNTRDPRETVFLRQRLSVAIQRGNSLAVQGTIRHQPIPRPRAQAEDGGS